MHHVLKLAKPYWEAKRDGLKPWEIRSCVDRNFSVGDTVEFVEIDAYLLELDGKKYAPLLGPFEIVYVLKNSPLLITGTCIFTHT